jgi:hypothetical protein
MCRRGLRSNQVVPPIKRREADSRHFAHHGIRPQGSGMIVNAFTVRQFPFEKSDHCPSSSQVLCEFCACDSHGLLCVGIGVENEDNFARLWNTLWHGSIKVRRSIFRRVHN